MNEQHAPESEGTASQQIKTQQSDFARISQWLNGEVTVTRKVLVMGATIALLLLGIALD